jgi:exopolysaccharide biosynthesis polyprenyl glycosylphosphotransferase
MDYSVVGRAGIRADVARADRASAPRAPHVSDRRVLLYAFDVLALLLASVIAAEVGGVAARPWSWMALGAAVIAWTLVAWVLDCYNVRRAARPRHSIAGVYAALLGTGLVLWASQRLAPGSLVLADPSPGWLVAAALSLGVARVAYAGVLTRAAFQRAVLVIGPEAVGLRLVGLIRSEAPREYRVVGWVSAEATAGPGSGLGRLGGYHDVPALVDSHHIAELIVADDVDVDLGRELVALYEHGVEVRHVSELYEEIAGRIAVGYLGSQWFVALRARAVGGRLYDVLRRLIDVIVAGGVLLAAAPLLAVLAIAVRLDSHGPAIFRQERTGYRGRCFTMYKFRTMLIDAEGDGPVWATPGDPRRTRLGRFLRPTRFDELPQLWNVLIGDMSLIGPRPERPTFVERLEAEIPFYRARLLVRPGISGWAQVRGSYASSVQDSVEKLEYDLYYVKHRSPYLDLVIALKTLGVLLRASGR